jgi:hypothetical protein
VLTSVLPLLRRCRLLVGMGYTLPSWRASQPNDDASCPKVQVRVRPQEFQQLADAHGLGMINERL